MIALIGSWWNLSPAILIVGSPLAFRLTCYYYRRSYYRGFFLSPPACAVPDARKRYTGGFAAPGERKPIHSRDPAFQSSSFPHGDTRTIHAQPSRAQAR